MTSHRSFVTSRIRASNPDGVLGVPPEGLVKCKHCKGRKVVRSSGGLPSGECRPCEGTGWLRK